VSAIFIQPLLEPSTPLVSFTYLYEEDVPTESQSQTVTLTNVLPLPLTVALRCAPPFTLDVGELTLEPKVGQPPSFYSFLLIPMSDT